MKKITFDENPPFRIFSAHFWSIIRPLVEWWSRLRDSEFYSLRSPLIFNSMRLRIFLKASAVCVQFCCCFKTFILLNLTKAVTFIDLFIRVNLSYLENNFSKEKKVAPIQNILRDLWMHSWSIRSGKHLKHVCFTFVSGLKQLFIFVLCRF